MLIKKILAVESLGMVHPERQSAEPRFGDGGLASVGGLKGWALAQLLHPLPLARCGWLCLPSSLVQPGLSRNDAFISKVP